jgi:DNA polymerase III delta prime subunit
MTLAALVEHHDWSEKYRPQTTAECIQTNEVRSFILKALNEKKVHNAVFVGTPGLGKTTTAMALGQELGMDVLKINSSKDGTMDELRTTMQHFVTTCSFNGEDKMLILDEGDNLHPKMMAALRGFIEEFSVGCTFIITVNNPSKVDPAILSRCPPVNFGVPADEKKLIMVEQCKMLKRIFEAEGIQHETKDLIHVVKSMYPDLRRMLRSVQRACKDGVFNPENLYIRTDDGMTELFEALKSGTYIKVLEWADRHPHLINTKEVYTSIYDAYRSHTDADTLVSAIIVIEESMDKATRSINPSITLLGCLARLLRDAPVS